MKYVDKEFDAKFIIPRNAFIKGKHPDKCPDCGEEPILSDINTSFIDDELWIAQCKCYKPNTKAVSGDSVEETVRNWDNLLRDINRRSR